jgi:hypothetical protein
MARVPHTTQLIITCKRTGQAGFVTVREVPVSESDSAGVGVSQTITGDTRVTPGILTGIDGMTCTETFLRVILRKGWPGVVPRGKDGYTLGGLVIRPVGGTPHPDAEPVSPLRNRRYHDDRANGETSRFAPICGVGRLQASNHTRTAGKSVSGMMDADSARSVVSVEHRCLSRSSSCSTAGASPPAPLRSSCSPGGSVTGHDEQRTDGPSGGTVGVVPGSGGTRTGRG